MAGAEQSEGFVQRFVIKRLYILALIGFQGFEA
jgi:hypothetical protein